MLNQMMIEKILNKSDRETRERLPDLMEVVAYLENHGPMPAFCERIRERMPHIMYGVESLRRTGILPFSIVTLDFDDYLAKCRTFLAPTGNGEGFHELYVIVEEAHEAFLIETFNWNSQLQIAFFDRSVEVASQGDLLKRTFLADFYCPRFEAGRIFEHSRGPWQPVEFICQPGVSFRSLLESADRIEKQIRRVWRRGGQPWTEFSGKKIVVEPKKPLFHFLKPSGW
ncbi:MAG: hypothetical protein V1821_02655 [bacterium]